MSTHLFLRLELVFDLKAEHGKQRAPAQWHAENLRVNEILNALHLALRQPALRNLRDDFHNEVAVGRFKILILTAKKVNLTHLNLRGS